MKTKKIKIIKRRPVKKYQELWELIWNFNEIKRYTSTSEKVMDWLNIEGKRVLEISQLQLSKEIPSDFRYKWDYAISSFFYDLYEYLTEQIRKGEKIKISNDWYVSLRKGVKLYVKLKSLDFSSNNLIY